MAFAAFCLVASSVYLINDLVDISADRQHPTKRNRAIPSGLIPPINAALAGFMLFSLGMATAFLVSILFAETVLSYFFLTLCYSLFIKRKMLIDIVVLSLLYTVRVVAGGVAIEVELSSWLIMFSIFFFTSLALIKRYAELRRLISLEGDDPANRNYRKGDLPVIGALAAASGMNSVTVFSLYIASPVVAANYSHPWVLWFICPLMLYLLGRMLIMAHRGDMNDDPIVYALTDRNWRIAAILFGGIFLGAI